MKITGVRVDPGGYGLSLSTGGIETVLNSGEIQFAFTGNAVRGRIQADWKDAIAFQEERVYIRTVGGGVFKIDGSLSDLKKCLPADQFLIVDQGIIVNLDRIRWLDLAVKNFPSIGFENETDPLNPKIDWVAPSRSGVQELRRIFLTPRRQQQTRCGYAWPG
jgi:hypothetical protein